MDKPTFYISDPLLKSPDFFNISPSVLCFTEEVFFSEHMGSLLGAVGEILEIKVEGKESPAYLLNPLARYNCLNHSTLEYRTPFHKIFPHITKFYFHKNRIGDSSIFKLPDSPSIPTLCLSSSDVESFYDIYMSNSYSGLDFKEIWSDEKNDV